jgi:hypothetical protein
MPYSAFGRTTTRSSVMLPMERLWNLTKTSTGRVVAVDPERHGVHDDIEAGGITEGLASTVQVGVPTPNQFLGEVWVNERG